MSISEITPTAVKIDKLISRVAEGDIKIPAFQRGLVWKQGQVIELLDSVYHNYPIGSILLWNSQDKLKATRNICGFDIPDRSDSYPVNYVLDGQQRLSAIYAVFCKDRKRETPEDTTFDAKTFDLVFDLVSKSFCAEQDLPEGHKSFALKCLFNVSAYFDAQSHLEKPEQELVQDLYSKFNNYEVPIVTITKRSKSEVGIIFERINSTGTKLTTLDLMIAWTWSDDFHLREKIDELLETLESKGFEELPEKIILQCLSAIIKKSTSTNAILNLEPKEVHDQFDALVASLEKTIDFLATQLKATKAFLPHVQQLVPLTYFFSKVKSPTSDQLKALKNWFWKTSFSNRYSAQTDQKMDADIVVFDDFVAEKFEGTNKYAYTVTADQLIKQKFTKSSPLVRAFLLLLAQNNPQDIVNGSFVDLDKALSEYNSKEYHHLFPRAHLKKSNVPAAKTNSLCNFTFLTSASNKKISSKAPSDYLTNITPADKRVQILESNLMPLKMEIYTQNSFDKFLELRSEHVIQFLDKQILQN